MTIVTTGVPASISGYTQIYDVRYNNLPDFSGAERAEYVTWLGTAGHTLFLMGENSSFTPRNTPICDFIALAGGGTIAPPASSSTAAETVNPVFATKPNVISTVAFNNFGLVTSKGTGAFATSESGGTSGGALYFAPGTLANALAGALVVVLM